MEAVLVLILLAAAWVAWRAMKSGSRSPSRASATSSRLRPREQIGFRWPNLGEFEFEVVGESHYQSVLQRLAGDHGTDGADADCEAELHPVNQNRFDKSAVEVLVLGQRVGFMSREDARSFRRRLGHKKLTGQSTFCNARVVGGWTDGQGAKKHYGLKLDLKTFDN